VRITGGLMKAQAYVLGIDDGCFDKFTSQQALVTGVMMRLNGNVEGVLSTQIEVDGTDSTEKISEMINTSRFKEQIRAVLVHGFTLAGFNILDIEKLHSKTGIPIIAVLRKQPDKGKVLNALSKLKSHNKERIDIFEKTYEMEKCGALYFKAAGINDADVRQLITQTAQSGNMPEPVRLAHLIASGVSRADGESRGRA